MLNYFWKSETAKNIYFIDNIFMLRSEIIWKKLLGDTLCASLVIEMFHRISFEEVIDIDKRKCRKVYRLYIYKSRRVEVWIWVFVWKMRFRWRHLFQDYDSRLIYSCYSWICDLWWKYCRCSFCTFYLFHYKTQENFFKPWQGKFSGRCIFDTSVSLTWSRLSPILCRGHG